MSDKAAKLIMYGMFAIAGCWLLSAIVEASDNKITSHRYQLKTTGSPCVGVSRKQARIPTR